MLEAALAAGLCAEGATVELLGVLPDARRSRACRRSTGVGAAMISASHNPFADNGIKLFAPGGLKLPDDVEEAIEAELDRCRAATTAARSPGSAVGSIVPRRGPGHRALRARPCSPRWTAGASTACGSCSTAPTAPRPRSRRRCSTPRRRRDGASTPSPTVATSTTAAARPIPRCVARRGARARRRPRPRLRRRRRPGARRRPRRRAGRRRPAHRHLRARPAGPRRAARRHRGRHRDDQPRLPAGMAAAGIDVVETAVGDRYVLEALERRRRVARRRAVRPRDLPRPGHDRRRPARPARARRRRHPRRASARRAGRRGDDPAAPGAAQRAAGVRHRPTSPNGSRPESRGAEARLGESGRVLVRPSGTEPLVRVMVEAPTEDVAGRDRRRSGRRGRSRQQPAAT